MTTTRNMGQIPLELVLGPVGNPNFRKNISDPNKMKFDLRNAVDDHQLETLRPLCEELLRIDPTGTVLHENLSIEQISGIRDLGSRPKPT